MMKNRLDWPAAAPREAPREAPHEAPHEPLRRHLSVAFAASASLAGVGALLAWAAGEGVRTARPAAPVLGPQQPKRPAAGAQSLQWQGGWILRQDDR